VKPENILVTNGDLDIELCDFGFAQAIDGHRFTHHLHRTRAYMAPELLIDERRRRYSSAIDVWAAGVVLYTCLNGQPPFSDELYSSDFPLKTQEQIELGIITWKSPCWDSIDVTARDLIRGMLTVSAAERMTATECHEHAWTLGQSQV
jgi:serine/threonine-protein kinase CHEK2